MRGGPPLPAPDALTLELVRVLALDVDDYVFQHVEKIRTEFMQEVRSSPDIRRVQGLRLRVPERRK